MRLALIGFDRATGAAAAVTSTSTAVVVFATSSVVVDLGFFFVLSAFPFHFRFVRVFLRNRKFNELEQV